MIRSFKHKGLRELFETGATSKVPDELQERCLNRLDALDSAGNLRDLNIPGFDCHPLHGKPLRYAISVSGVWRMTFEWNKKDGDAYRVDLEQYH